MLHPLFIGPIGPTEMIVILVIGLLIFGNRLPEVGRSLGRGLMEFKRGLRNMQDEVSSVDKESDSLIDKELAERRRIEASETPAPPLARAAAEPDAEESAAAREGSAGDPQPDSERPNRP